MERRTEIQRISIYRWRIRIRNEKNHNPSLQVISKDWLFEKAEGRLWSPTAFHLLHWFLPTIHDPIIAHEVQVKNRFLHFFSSLLIPSRLAIELVEQWQVRARIWRHRLCVIAFDARTRTQERNAHGVYIIESWRVEVNVECIEIDPVYRTETRRSWGLLFSCDGLIDERLEQGIAAADQRNIIVSL